MAQLKIPHKITITEGDGQKGQEKKAGMCGLYWVTLIKLETLFL